MASRSPALPYAAVTALALLTGSLSGLQRFLPVLLSERGITASGTSVVLFGTNVLNALLVPVGAVALGYAFAGVFDVETRLGRTVAATYLLALAGSVVGYAVGGTAAPDTASVVGSLPLRLLTGVVTGSVGALTFTVAVVAGAAVHRLRAS